MGDGISGQCWIPIQKGTSLKFVILLQFLFLHQNLSMTRKLVNSSVIGVNFSVESGDAKFVRVIILYIFCQRKNENVRYFDRRMWYSFSFKDSVHFFYQLGFVSSHHLVQYTFQVVAILLSYYHANLVSCYPSSHSFLFKGFNQQNTGLFIPIVI